MIEYSTSMKLRIDWSELDAFGHINNLAILRYSQTARLNYLEEIGMMQYHRERGIGPVLASTSCQFKRQLFYPGRVTVRSLVDHVRTTSFHIRHALFDDAGARVADVHDVLVLFDFNRHTKVAIPDVFHDRIQVLKFTQEG